MHLRYRKVVWGILILAVVAGLDFWAFRGLDRLEEATGKELAPEAAAEGVFYSEPVRVDAGEVNSVAPVLEDEVRSEIVEKNWSMNLDALGRGKRVRLLERDGVAYPVRSVETVAMDPLSGELSVLASMEMVADRILLRFAQEQTLEELDMLALRLKGTFERQVGGRPLYQFRFASYELNSVPLALAALEGDAFPFNSFLYAEPDYVVHALVEPNDTRYLNGSLWGMHNTGQNSGTDDADIDAPKGWDIRTSSEGVVVAVIDSGVNYLHEDLAVNIWTNVEEIPGNGIDDDENGYVDDVYGINSIENTGDPFDDNGHGTHVSGTIGAVGNNGVGVAGVAWTTQIMGLKFLGSNGSGTISDAVECVDYAVAMGADVLSNSWGGGGYSQAMFEAIESAADEGVVFVAAAGNSGVNTDEQVSYPAGYDIENIISVAAIDRFGKLSPFSNYGINSVDIAAPGSAIESTWIGGTDSYKTSSGTSMATPHVSGILALLMAEYSDDGLQANMNRLLYGAEKVDALTDFVATGARANLASSLLLVEAPSPPVFKVRPLRHYVERRGGSLIASVEVESELPVSYQWYFEGLALEGETSARLELGNLESGDVGNYRVDVVNGDGVASSRFVLDVLDPVTAFAGAVEQETLDAFSFGDVLWDVYFGDSYEGDSSVRSGPIDDGQESVLFLNVQGPVDLAFHWRVSSEQYWDIGYLLVDGEIHSSLSGESDWQEVMISLKESRSYRIEWRYSKDGSASVGQDFLIVDAIEFRVQGESPPVILGEPVGASLSLGAVYVLRTEVLGSDLSFQWYKDGTPLVGSTESGIVIQMDSRNKEGGYVLEVTNPFGSAISDLAAIQLGSLPVSVVASPQGLIRSTGEEAVFSVTVVGSLPIYFQWYKNETPILGATEASLELLNLEPVDEGMYHVTVRNAHSGAAIATEEAELEIIDVAVRPRFVKHPRGGFWREGETVRLSVVIEGAFPITYQWFKDEVPLVGANQRFYELGSVLEENSGIYHLEATNAHGFAVSDEATVFVIGDIGKAIDMPEQVWQHSGNAYFFSQNKVTRDGVDALQSSKVDTLFPKYVSLSVEVVGPTNFTLYWKQEESGYASFVELYVDDELQSSLKSASNWKKAIGRVGEGTHTVKIAGAIEAGSTVWLDEATFDRGPVVYRQPDSQLLLEGDSLELSVDAFGAKELSYQWFWNGQVLEGRTESSLSLVGEPLILVGAYFVEIENSYGVTVSQTAVIETIEDWLVEVGDDTVELIDNGLNSWSPWRIPTGEIILRSRSTEEGSSSEQRAVVEGPGVLVYNVGVLASVCCHFVDTFLDEELVERTGAQGTGGELVLRERRVRVPEGVHEIRWFFEPEEEGQYGFLDNIRLVTAPIITNQSPNQREIERDEAYMSVVVFEQGTGEMYQWFHDGELILGAESNAYRPMNLSERDQGWYHCVVTGQNGETATSQKILLEVVTGVYESVGFGEFIYGANNWAPQSEVSWDGNGSLEYVGDSELASLNMALRFDQDPDERRALRFMIRIEGMGEDDSIDVRESGGKWIQLNENTDWREIIVPLNGYNGAERDTVYWQASSPNGVTADGLKVWIDAIELINRPVFYTEPVSLIGHYGSIQNIGAVALGTNSMDFKWEKSGSVIEDAQENSLQLAMGFRSPENYAVTASNAYGEISSGDAFVGLSEIEMGAAIGRPGSVSTKGTVLWELRDDEVWQGDESVGVSLSGSSEYSELLFDVVGSGTLSFAWKIDSPTGLERMYCYIGDTLVSALIPGQRRGWQDFSLELPESSKYSVRVRFFSYAADGGGSQPGQGWLDALRFEADEGLTYDAWQAFEFAGADDVPEAMRVWDADADQDGLTNFAEYAFVLDVLREDVAPTPQFLLEEDRLWVVLDFKTPAKTNDVLLGLEVSEDLVNWYPVGSQYVVSDVETNSGSLYFEVPKEDRNSAIYARVGLWYLNGSE